MEALRAMDGARWRDAVDPTIEARAAPSVDVATLGGIDSTLGVAA
jgi:hypothetical protein